MLFFVRFLSELRDDCAAAKIDEAFFFYCKHLSRKNWLIYHLRVVEFMKRLSLQYMPVHCVVVEHFLETVRYSVHPTTSTTVFPAIAAYWKNLTGVHLTVVPRQL